MPLEFGSPRLSDSQFAAVSPLPNFVVRTTEVAELVRDGRRRGAVSVAIGSGRDHRSKVAAEGFATAWRDAGGCVVAIVDWPEDAASWLRQASRLTAAEPDLWMLGGPARGFVQQLRRLAWSTRWTPYRTLTYQCLAHPAVVGLAGRGTLDGLSGVGADGRRWWVDDDRVCGVSPQTRVGANRAGVLGGGRARRSVPIPDAIADRE